MFYQGFAGRPEPVAAQSTRSLAAGARYRPATRVSP